MALEDGFIRIKTKIDGLAKALSGFKELGLGVAGLGTIFKTLTGAVKQLYAGLDELNKAYKAQKNAEVQLETAVKNNPYLDGSSIRRLKDYASQLQSISTIGDEQLLPFMAQLAASGRDEAQIMQIMKAALDASASGMISLDEAVRGLNLSYTGQIGRLGMQIPALKNLTAEELKQGKAIDVVAKTYKGLAEETAKATGSTEQLKNAWGDLKEEYGRDVEKTMGPIRKFFTAIIQGWTESKKAAREYKEAQEEAAGAIIKAADSIADKELQAMQKRRNDLLAEIETLKEELRKIEAGKETGLPESPLLAQEIELRQKKLALLQDEVKSYNEKINSVIELRDAAKEEADADQAAVDRAAQEADEVEAAANKRAEFISKNEKDREKALQQLELEAKARGEEIDDSKKLDIYMKSYLNLITESEGMVTAESEEAQKLLGIVRELVKAAQDKAAAEEAAAKAEEFATRDAETRAQLRLAEQEAAQKMLSDFQSQLDAISVPDDRSLEEQIADQRRTLEEFYDEIMGMETISEEEKESLQEEFTQKRIALIQQEKEAAIAALDEEKEKRKELAKEALSQLVNTVNTMGSLAKENSQARLDVKIAEIEAEELSEEEKNKKILEAQKKAAREQYRIELWQWTVSSLQAAANIAEGISKCFAENGPWGFVTSALVAAAGAAQIATIIANKPQPPAFATGGIVPGNSYSGDRVHALVNSGEMILNRQQQAALFRMANGEASAGTNINIKNFRANDVDVSASVTGKDIEIIIDRRVKDSLARGRYDRELLMQQNAQNGTRITN